jgi:hypothetical protein
MDAGAPKGRVFSAKRLLFILSPEEIKVSIPDLPRPTDDDPQRQDPAVGRENLPGQSLGEIFLLLALHGRLLTHLITDVRPAVGAEIQSGFLWGGEGVHHTV